MTERELRLLLTTTYKGDAAAKMISDLDKISSSGQKTAQAIQKIGPELRKLYAAASPSAKASLVSQFPELAGIASGQTSFLPNEKMLKSGAARAMAMGKFPSFGAIMQSEKFLSQGASSLLSMGPMGGGMQLPNEKILAAGVKRALSMGPLFAPSGPGFLSQFGSSIAGKFGIGRAAMAGGVAGVTAFAVLEGLKFEMKALTKVMNSMVGAIYSARDLYAKALTSGGLGLGFTARREALASILGVSAKDVYQFGQAVLFLNPKIEWATNIIAKTTPNLTATAWEFNVLKLNIEALFASLANDAAPALRAFAEGLSMLVKLLERSKGTLEFLFKTALTAAAVAVGGPGAGEVVNRAFNQLNAQGGPAAPQPLAFMKQLQASAIERMGLVVGFSGSSNPALETARNTKKMADGIDKIVRHMGKEGTFYDPFSVRQSYP